MYCVAGFLLDCFSSASTNEDGPRRFHVALKRMAVFWKGLPYAYPICLVHMLIAYPELPRRHWLRALEGGTCVEIHGNMLEIHPHLAS